MIKRLKEKWGIKSGVQVIIILIVFAITGFSTLYVKDFIFDLIGIDKITLLWIKVPVYILVVFPAYQIILLVVGAIFGQFQFFWNFEKKMFNRFRINKKKKQQLKWSEDL